jgi:DNA-binding response OmpR family regulator
MAAYRLLVIDDDQSATDLVRTVAESEDFEVRTGRGIGIKLIYDDFVPDAITLNIVMPELDGFELLKYLAARHCDAPIILFGESGNNFGEMAEELATAYGLKIAGSMRKPLWIPDLRRHLAALKEAS